MSAAGGAGPALRLRGITKRFGPVVANDDISFDVMPGEVVALLGENGAGKTTLMSILFGHYVADAGSIEVFGTPLPPGQPRAALEAGVGIVHQHFTLAENMSVLENIVLGTATGWRLDRRAAARRIAALSAEFGLAVDASAPVADLSVGERQRVEILKALYRDARILILDEPTAVLTPQESAALFATLKRMVARGLVILFISHKLGEVMAVSDRVVVLRGGRMAGARAVGETSREALTALMVGREVAMPDVPAVTPGPVRLELRGVSARAGTLALKDVDLSLRAGEITGISGVSGNGQSVLADVLSGLVAPSAGAIRIDGREVTGWTPQEAVAAGLARIPEDRHGTGTIGDMSLAENAVSERYRDPAFSRMGVLDRGAARRFAERIVEDYEVKAPGPDAPIRLLSGGNMQKLILGRVLDGAPEVILANQPTRGLDIGAVAYVHGVLLEARARGAAILLISEDLDEVRALSDRIQVMSGGRLSAASPRGALGVVELGAMMAGVTDAA